MTTGGRRPAGRGALRRAEVQPVDGSLTDHQRSSSANSSFRRRVTSVSCGGCSWQPRSGWVPDLGPSYQSGAEAPALRDKAALLQFPLEHGFQGRRATVRGAARARSRLRSAAAAAGRGAIAFQHGHTRAVGVDGQRSDEGVLLAVLANGVNEPLRDGRRAVVAGHRDAQHRRFEIEGRPCRRPSRRRPPLYSRWSPAPSPWRVSA